MLGSMFDYVHQACIPKDFVYIRVDKNSKFAEIQIQVTLKNKIKTPNRNVLPNLSFLAVYKIKIIYV